MRKNLRLTENEFMDLISDIVKEETESSSNMMVIKKGQEVLNTEDKKKRFIELCKECLAEFDKKERGFSANMQVEQVLIGASLFFIAGAVFLDFLVVAIPAGLGLIMLGSEVRQKWMKVIRCARNKRKGVTTMDNTTNTSTPEKTVQESTMKKTIRLTESELVKLVQRIIKEDEMEVNPCREASLQKSTTLRKIFKNKIEEKVYGAAATGTPFCVSGKDGLFTEMKTNIKIKPDTPIFSKNCRVDVYPLMNGMAAGNHLYFNFNNEIATKG